jgi:hypothetical protein
LNGLEVDLKDENGHEIQTEDGEMYRMDKVEDKIRSYVGKQLCAMFPSKTSDGHSLFKRSTFLAEKDPRRSLLGF